MCAAWATQSETVQAQDPLQMRKEHFHLFLSLQEIAYFVVRAIARATSRDPASRGSSKCLPKTSVLRDVT
jgi:hypothetical protein